MPINQNINYLVNHKVMYIFDEYEEAVFEFTGTGKGNYCKIKFKGKQPYKVECITNIAFEALLGGKIITQEEYDNY